MTDSIYPLSAKNNKNETIEFKNYKGKVLLIVNTASACGLTPQYEGLQALYAEYQGQNFEVLAFPCNQFKQQEKGSSEEIQQFCNLRFNIKFPLFDKIEVNGANTHPLFSFLKDKAPGILGSKSIKWNFTKFLINRKGEVVQRFAPTTKPEKIKTAIEKLLNT
jgi:glutathione peroxidase